MGNVVDDLEALRKRVDGLEFRESEDGCDFETRITELEDGKNDLAQLAERVGRMEARVAGMERTDPVLVDAMLRRLDALESAETELRDRIMRLENETEGHGGYTERLTALESAVAGDTERGLAEMIRKLPRPDNLIDKKKFVAEMRAQGFGEYVNPDFTEPREPDASVRVEAHDPEKQPVADALAAGLNFLATRADVEAMERRLMNEIGVTSGCVAKSERRILARVDAWGALLEWVVVDASASQNPTKDDTDRYTAALRALGRDGNTEADDE